jgi:hypothetical protein
MRSIVLRQLLFRALEAAALFLFAHRAFCASLMRLRASALIFRRRRLGTAAADAASLRGGRPGPRSAMNPRPGARSSGNIAKIAAASWASSSNRCSAPTTAYRRRSLFSRFATRHSILSATR